MRVARALAPADVAGARVVDAANAGIERALIRALPADWSGTYHSAAFSQHDWVGRDGGRPQEPSRPQGRLSGLVVPSDTEVRLLDLPIAERELRDGYVRRPAGPYDVWIRRDLTRG